MKTFLLFAVILLVIYIQETKGQNCPIEVENCLCEPFQGGHDIWCPNRFEHEIRVHYKRPGFLFIFCNAERQPQMVSADLIFQLRNIKVGRLDSLDIKFCPLPSGSLSTITDAMQVKDLKVLRIQYGNFGESGNKLVKNHFLGLRNLTILHLTGSHLQQVESGSFSGIGNLEWLSIASNDISRFQEGTFEELRNLKKLEIVEKELKQVKEKVFQPLINLEQLKLSLKNLRQIPERLFERNINIKTIKFIDMNNAKNLIQDKLFRELRDLRNISFVGQGLENIPAGVFDTNKNLERFDWLYYRCSDTRKPCTVKIPPLFKDPSSLKKFTVTKTIRAKLELPSNLFEGADDLEEVSITSAGVTRIEESLFKSSQKLKSIVMSDNEIIELPEAIFVEKTRLETVVLSNNLIVEVEDIFSSNPKLKKLDLSQNKITRVHPRLLISNTRLAHLDMSSNLLESLPNWDSSVELKFVDLSGNNISLTSLPYQWSTSWLQLQSLNLSQNNIGPSLNIHDLNFKQSLITVDLSGNKIKRIDFREATVLVDESHKRASHLHKPEINISSNPLACDCQALPLAKFIHGQLKSPVQSWLRFIGSDISCSSPEALKGQNIRLIQWDDFKCKFEDVNLKCPEGCNCIFIPNSKIYRINCSSFSAGEVFVPKVEDGVVELSVQGIHSLDDLKNVEGYEQVKSLNLANNRIRSIQASDFPPSLSRDLDLSNNQIKIIGSQVLSVMNHLQSIEMSGNPFACDCYNVELFRFLKEKREIVKDYRNVTFICDDVRTLVTNIKEAGDFCASVHKNIVLYVLPPVLVVLLMLFMLSLCLYHREKIFIWLYSNRRTRQFFTDDPDGKHLPYDVFISYAHQDSIFVETCLVPGLEDSDNIKYKCLVHVRDFVPGRNISEQIVEAVDNSRRTLVCLSKSFLASDWAKLEFEAAHSRNRVILVLVGGEVPSKDEMGDVMHDYVSTNTYLDSRDPWFWEKLRYALPHQGSDKPKNKEFLGPRSRRRVYSDHMQLINPSLSQLDQSVTYNNAPEQNGHTDLFNQP